MEIKSNYLPLLLLLKNRFLKNKAVQIQKYIQNRIMKDACFKFLIRQWLEVKILLISLNRNRNSVKIFNIKDNMVQINSHKNWISLLIKVKICYQFYNIWASNPGLLIIPYLYQIRLSVTLLSLINNSLRKLTEH